ncbi:hypothetical protein HDU89_004665 [Geranomyces variabilis]|nr:hypothetical protein HDU89_004665 [Geranomyces variabilis]
MDSPHYSLEDFEPASNEDLPSSQQQREQREQRQASESALYASDFDLPPNSTRSSATPSASSRQRQNASSRNNSNLPNSQQQQQVSASALYASDFDLPPNSTRPSASGSATFRQLQNASNRTTSDLANTQQQQVSASALYASDFDLPPNSTRPSASPSANSRQRQDASHRSSRSLAAGGQGRDKLEFEDNFEMGSSRDVAAGVGLRSSGSALRRLESGGARRVSEAGGDAGRQSLNQGGQVGDLEGNQDASGCENVFADAVDSAAHVDTVSGAVALESPPSSDHIVGSVDFGRGENDGGMVVAPRVSPPPTWSEPYEQQLEQNVVDIPTKSLHYTADAHGSSSLARESRAASTAQVGFAELPSAPSEQLDTSVKELQGDKITFAVAAMDAGTVVEHQQQQESYQAIRSSSSHLMGNANTPPPGVRWNLDSGSRSGEAVVKKKPRARVVAKAPAKQVTISLPSPTPSPPPLSARKRPGYRDRIRAAHASVPSHVTHPRAPHHSSSSPATGGASATAAVGGGSDTPPTRAARREQTLQEQADLEADRQRVQAIVDLLERKRAEFREQKRVEVEEHAARARARREHLDARHERAQAEAAELTRTTLAAYHKLYPRTDPLIHRNIIPADWTSTLWYREAVEQAHHRLPDTRNKPHPHCTAMLPTKLGRGISSDVVFGRLLTPGVRAFRAPEEGEEEDDDYDDYDMAFARHAPITTLPPIPIPSMPSLDLSIRLSGESEELYETAELGKKHEPATAKYHHQFTRMSENIVRNKETVTKLLAHKPPLFGTSFASVATPDDDGYGDGAGGVDGGLKLSIHDLAEGGGADALFADRGYEIHVRRVGTSGGGGVEAEQQQVDATAAVELPAGGIAQTELPTHMQLSSAGILRSATTGFTVQAAEQLTRDIVSGSRRGSVAVRELLTAPVAPSPASIASALATNWQRRPSSVHAKPILEEAATTASQTAADISGPAETLHEESEPEDGEVGQTEENATPPDNDDDDGGDGAGADAVQARSRSRSASIPRSRARSSSAAVSASSSSQNDDEDDDDSQQGFDESDEESTSRLFDTSRARTAFSHHKASSSMQSSAFSRRLTSASTERSVASTRTGSANLDSRASSLGRGRSASSGGFSSAGSVASGNGDGEEHQHHHHRRGRRRQREVSKLAAAAGPTTATTSPTREQDADGSTTKPRKHTLMPLTLDEVIAWEGLKIMQPVVRIKRKMWTVV